VRGSKVAILTNLRLKIVRENMHPKETKIMCIVSMPRNFQPEVRDLINTGKRIKKDNEKKYHSFGRTLFKPFEKRLQNV